MVEIKQTNTDSTIKGLRSFFKQYPAIKEALETIFTSIAVLLVIYMTIAFPEVIVGESMEPTLQTGDRVLVENFTKRFGTYERGDVVVLIPATEDEKHFIKRIIGIPGDIIKVVDCGVFISRDSEKFKLNESYLQENTCTRGGNGLREGRSIRLGANEFVVLGDNRGNSVDSRMFGIVKKEEIIGKAVVRFWPPTKYTYL